jgi:hypothetical protein
MKSIYERLDEIMSRIIDKSFRENKGLGNDIGFYVFDYEPKDEMLVRDRIKFIKEKALSSHGIKIVEFDLYEIIIEILGSRGYLNANFVMEQEEGTEYVIEAIQTSLRLTTEEDLIVNYIQERVNDSDIVFLTGVGKSWPIIRSHIILNSLHSVVEEQPLVMFFPGNYDGGTLMLFNALKDDNYYRAFPLVDKY